MSCHAPFAFALLACLSAGVALAHPPGHPGTPGGMPGGMRGAPMPAVGHGVQQQMSERAARQGAPSQVTAQDVMANWDQVQETELGNEIIDEFLENAGSDKSPEQILREAIDTVLARHGVDAETRGEAAGAAGGALWPGAGSGAEDHPHGPGGTDVASAPDEPVVLTEQQIKDTVAWGVRNGRPPEDIRKDLAGLNDALGGRGDVPMPGWETSRSGEVFFPSQEDAGHYHDAQADLGWVETRAERIKAEQAKLAAESERWSEVARAVENRWIAGTTDLLGTDDDLRARIRAVDDQIEALEREPEGIFRGTTNPDGSPDFGTEIVGWTYGGQDFQDAAAAQEAYENRHARIERLEAEKAALPSYVELIQRKTKDPDAPLRPEQAGLSPSWFNLPEEKLQEIGSRQDALRQETKSLQGTKKQALSTLGKIESRYDVK
jgi:hypothetical protein